MPPVRPSSAAAPPADAASGSGSVDAAATPDHQAGNGSPLPGRPSSPLGGTSGPSGSAPDGTPAPAARPPTLATPPAASPAAKASSSTRLDGGFGASRSSLSLAPYLGTASAVPSSLTGGVVSAPPGSQAGATTTPGAADSRSATSAGQRRATPPAEPAIPSPAVPHRLATVMVFNLLIPTAVLALFKGFGDYHSVYDQTYGRLERWTATLADVWEPVLREVDRERGVGAREAAGRLKREVHRLLTEHGRSVPDLRFAALLSGDGAVLASAGEWPDVATGRLAAKVTSMAAGGAGADEAHTELLPGRPRQARAPPAAGAGQEDADPADGEEFLVARRTAAPTTVLDQRLQRPPGARDDLPLPVVVCVFDSTDTAARFRGRLIRLLGMDAGLAVLVAVLGYLLVWRFVIAPVRRLHRGAVMIAAGRLDHRIAADSPDELGLLAAGFNTMADQLAAGYRELEGRNARLRADRAYAGRLQQRLLPARLPAPPGAGIGVHYEPSEDLGGDFYDAFPIDDGRVAVYVADVAGHGIGAALITIFIRENISRLRDDAGEGLAGRPGAMLAALRDRFAEEDFGSLFVSMVYGVLDVRRRRFRFASAGHPMPLVGQEGLVHEADGETGPVLSGFLPADMEFPEHELELPAGGRMLLTTDGVTDLLGPDGRAFGASRLRRLLAEHPGLPAGLWAEHAGQVLRAHRAGVPPTDDVTLLAVQME